jgi:hypothetical protein
MPEVTWQVALARYRVPRHLETRARRAAFRAATDRTALVVTPSSEDPRRTTRAQFERNLPLIDRAGRGPLLEARSSGGQPSLSAPEPVRTSGAIAAEARWPAMVGHF